MMDKLYGVIIICVAFIAFGTIVDYSYKSGISEGYEKGFIEGGRSGSCFVFSEVNKLFTCFNTVEAADDGIALSIEVNPECMRQLDQELYRNISITCGGYK